jgi:hypothetical protein
MICKQCNKDKSEWIIKKSDPNRAYCSERCRLNYNSKIYRHNKKVFFIEDDILFGYKEGEKT